MPHIDWPIPDEHPPLAEEEVHAWAVTLPAPPAAERAYSACLTAQERERATRFVNADHRLRYQTARGALRHILAAYLQRPPGELEIGYDEGGKPRLDGREAGRLHFNLSHTRGLALVVVSRTLEVGVDVEIERAIPDADAIARRVFPDAERREWEALPVERRQDEFIRRWTELEARLKALGQGVWRGARLDDERLSVTPLPVAAGWTAALGVVGRTDRVKTWRWDHVELPAHA